MHAHQLQRPSSACALDNRLCTQVNLHGPCSLAPVDMHGRLSSPVVGNDGEDVVEHGEGGFSGELGARHGMQGDDAQRLIMQAGVLGQAHDRPEDREDEAVRRAGD